MPQQRRKKQAFKRNSSNNLKCQIDAQKELREFKESLKKKQKK